jgi:hypothetical protein
MKAMTKKSKEREEMPMNTRSKRSMRGHAKTARKAKGWKKFWNRYCAM